MILSASVKKLMVETTTAPGSNDNRLFEFETAQVATDNYRLLALDVDATHLYTAFHYFGIETGNNQINSTLNRNSTTTSSSTTFGNKTDNDAVNRFIAITNLLLQ